MTTSSGATAVAGKPVAKRKLSNEMSTALVLVGIALMHPTSAYFASAMPKVARSSALASRAIRACLN